MWGLQKGALLLFLSWASNGVKKLKPFFLMGNERGKGA
ncbi:MAG: hypothetical protein XD96_1323 [Petrotoga mobilis]|nr:MAG: hypothetical protein XD96_1323 [Petrotoga mobilis]